jgi:Protein of unknown function (DUF2905)
MLRFLRSMAEISGRGKGNGREDREAEAMEFGKLLVVGGVALVVAGIVLMLLGRVNFHLGRLPGDFIYRGKNTTVYLPLATSILLSVVLSILLYLVSRGKR